MEIATNKASSRRREAPGRRAGSSLAARLNFTLCVKNEIMNSLMQTFLTKQFSGVIGITALLGWVVLTEIGSSSIGGDLGSFLYTTFHFIVNPILSLAVLILAAWHGIKTEKALIKTIDLTACIIPAAIIHTGITGSFWLSELLGVKF